ncbi:TPA: hypothetical protein HA235_04115 [Candidatus Woesearchaeota archaeon]|nr:hypothetical protein [uncultured archaeon]MBS3173041.1 hypothetical protein [Candidatus Woesearchaeota archaeon]AQS32950.1 hypothetical protein [uncultured archaeon]HIH31869.1 hypothetical protein [Candidatus Woesearchaeota archaeon]HIH54380.1 hypothetical protein [Candidatus Woesearchaeota archaeon]
MNKLIIPLFAFFSFIAYQGCNSNHSTSQNQPTPAVEQESLEDIAKREEKRIDSLRTIQEDKYNRLIGTNDAVYGSFPKRQGGVELYKIFNSSDLLYIRWEDESLVVDPDDYKYKGMLRLKIYVDPSLNDSAKGSNTKINAGDWQMDNAFPGTWFKDVQVDSEIDTSKKTYRLSVINGNKCITYNCVIDPDIEIDKISVNQDGNKRQYNINNIDNELAQEQRDLFDLYMSALERLKKDQVRADLN